MARYVVTGGAGFIGSHIVDALVAQGDEVCVFDNFSTGRRENLDQVVGKIELIEGDLADAGAVDRALRGAEVVFHQGALASVPRSVEAPLETHQACVTGTLCVLDAARRHNVRRVVYAASSSAYGDLPYSSKRESDVIQPLSPYAAAKLSGENYCVAFYHTYGLETVCLRYFNVFGPRQDPDSPYSAVIPIFITRMLTGKRPVVYGDGRQSRDFTFVENVVQANLLAADAPAACGRTINVANGKSTELLQLIEVLNQLLELDVEPLFEPPRAGDVKDSLADITQAQQLLNYSPKVDFVEGLERSIEYYRRTCTS